MSKQAQIKIIRAAYDALPDIQDGFYDVRERLFDMNLIQERRYRKSHPAVKGFSANDAAKYFVVSHLLDGYAKPDRYTVDDILSIRNEVLYAQAYAKRFHDELKAWYEEYAPKFAAIDYSELMK